MTTRAFLLVALGSIATATIFFFFAFREMAAIAPQCIGGGNGIECRGFASWIWLGIAASSIALVCLVIPGVQYARNLLMSHSNRVSFFVIGALVLVTVFVGAYFVLSQGVLRDRLSARVTSQDDGLTPQVSPQAAGRGVPSPFQTVTKPPRHPFPEIPRTREGSSLADDPFVAQSVEERRWLDRNGYPNARQWQALLQASDAQLRQAAESGDVSAQALFYQRRLINGDQSALGSMIESGAKGSTFALELLSSTLATSPEDRVMAYAFSRVAEMQGNYRIAAGREIMFGATGLSDSERRDAEGEALTLYNNMLHIQRSTKGSNSRAVDPRPLVRS